MIWLRIPWPLGEHHAEHLWDDITRALNGDGITHTDVEPRDLLRIVQRRFCTTTPPIVLERVGRRESARRCGRPESRSP